jgi:hypothetical protein
VAVGKSATTAFGEAHSGSQFSPLLASCLEYSVLSKACIPLGYAFGLHCHNKMVWLALHCMLLPLLVDKVAIVTLAVLQVQYKYVAAVRQWMT